MRTMRLKISVSGVRGVVGETLTPRLLSRFAQAYGTYVGPGKVLVGRDTRPSGQMVVDAVFAGLLATGCTPIDLGVVPIPALQYQLSRSPDVRGGIAVTASHNPIEWNALKLLSAAGLFLSTDQANELLDIYNQGTFRRVDGRHVQVPGHDDSTVEAHLDAVLDQVDVSSIRGARIRVALDCVNGAGAIAAPLLLSRLGCKVTHRLGCQPSGHFHRPPEPLPKNLTALCEKVRQTRAHVGFAQDADADRLAVVDGAGRALEGDVMMALLVDLAIARKPGTVVVNLSTSQLIDFVARRRGVRVVRSPVGEANVVAAMQAHDAVVGGEGSGGLIFPGIHTCRDSFIGMALVLEYLARGECTVAELVDRLPARVMIREKLPLTSTMARKLLAELRSRYAGEDLDLRDGVRVTWPDRWVHVRASNTEPVVRVIAEAPDEEGAEELKRQVMEFVPGSV